VQPDAGLPPRCRGVILSEPPVDHVPPELAPFLASARTDLEAATDGLQPAEAIERLESMLARTEIEASRLGIRFDQLGGDSESVAVGDGGGPVVVIRRFISPDDEDA
jgi:hypothetical protein